MRRAIRAAAVTAAAMGALVLGSGVALADVYAGYFWVDSAGGGSGAALVQCNSVGNAEVNQNDYDNKYYAWHCDSQWDGGYKLWLEETVDRTPRT